MTVMLRSGYSARTGVAAAAQAAKIATVPRPVSVHRVTNFIKASLTVWAAGLARPGVAPLRGVCVND
jgi:hypothetical protein